MMSVEEHARVMLSRLLEIGHQQTEPVTARMLQICSQAFRFYYQAVLRTKLVTGPDFFVHHGPFSGMRLASDFLPMLIGSYEAELHATIQAFAHRGYERVINIGCGDGYYAVGLARLLPSARVFALDPDQAAQTFCRSSAERNGVVDRMTIMGECTPAILHELACPGTLVFCDCEGNELKLLDPALVPMLSRCDMLVEMHDFICPGASTTLETRFRSTHTTTIIPPSGRDLSAYPVLESFSELDRVLAMCEFRPGPTPWGLFLSNPSMPSASTNSISSDAGGAKH